MKLSERIALLKGGYTKAEIDEIIRSEAEQKPEESAEPTPAAPSGDYDTILKVMKSMADEINGLKTSVQAANIQNTDIKTGTASPTPEEILGSLFADPNSNNKEK